MKTRVLIAEDDMSWVGIYKAILPTKDYEILLILDENKSEGEIEDNLKQLLTEYQILKRTDELLTENHIDFSIVNINLLASPNESRDLLGVDLLEKIRDKKPKLPIIVVSGDPSDVNYSKYKSLDIDEVFYKGSFSPAKFLKIVDEIVTDNTEKKTGQCDVFLCHNSNDKPAVKVVAEELKRRGIKPWLDEWELRPGLPWQPVIEEQIESIKTAVVFVGESGLGPWQDVEIRSLLSEFVKRNIPVVPVIFDNAPQKPELPLFLREMVWVDFRKEDPNPIEQLVWGITGQKKDD